LKPLELALDDDICSIAGSEPIEDTRGLTAVENDVTSDTVIPKAAPRAPELAESAMA